MARSALSPLDIERYLTHIARPVLLVQGYEDEYGTMEQLERIVRGAKQTDSLKLERCRHSPHRDQPAQVLAAARRFMSERVSPYRYPHEPASRN